MTQDRRIWRLHLHAGRHGDAGGDQAFNASTLAKFVAGGVAPEVREAMLAGLLRR